MYIQYNIYTKVRVKQMIKCTLPLIILSYKRHLASTLLLTYYLHIVKTKKQALILVNMHVNNMIIICIYKSKKTTRVRTNHSPGVP